MKYVLGIDVGGTKIASGLVKPNLELSEVKVVPTSQTDLVTQIIEIINQYQGYDAIGLTLPGPVDSSGWAKRLPNIENFEATNFHQVLSDRFHVPVRVVNDAKAFAYLESVVGAGANKKTVAGIVLGTGTGVGVVINKHIYFGKDGLAGEFDHVVMPNGQLLRDQVKSARPFRDASAARVYLKQLISLVVLSFNPDIIILGGGWSSIDGLESVANELATNVGGYENQTLVMISKFQFPSLLGAALLVLKGNR